MLSIPHLVLQRISEENLISFKAFEKLAEENSRSRIELHWIIPKLTQLGRCFSMP